MIGISELDIAGRLLLGGGTGDEAFRFDPGRLAAGAITGIGFLGAEVVLKSGLNVHGLTTAACLWIVSAIGLAVGSGRMTCRITIASEQRISERTIVDALARFPAVRHIRVQP